MGDSTKKASFAELALALAGDYESIYVIDSEDDSYVEYSSVGAENELVEVASGDDFFKAVVRDCREQVWPQDQGYFLRAFRKARLLEALERGRSFDLRYRMSINNEPQYYYLKTIRNNGEDIIIGVKNVDEQTRQEMEENKEQLIFSEIAKSLGSLFEVIYYIDIKTGKYTEYCASQSYSETGIASEGEDFFRNVQEDIEKHIYPDDRDMLCFALEKQNLLKSLKESDSLTFNYRQVLDGKIQYLSLIVFQRGNDSDHLVVAVRNVDSETRREKELSSENQVFNEIAMALARRYEVIYRVNINTNDYSELSANENYTRLGSGEKSNDFFKESANNMKTDVHPEDYPMMSVALQKENLLNNLKENGALFLRYRLIKEGKIIHLAMFAVRPSEDSDHIILAIANVDHAKRKAEEFESAVESASNMVNRDPLTGLQNKRYYVQTEMMMDSWIASGEKNIQFALLLCDMNGLKEVNDKEGHKAGDQYIVEIAQMLDSIFKDSDVFRIGGDEFVILLYSKDYEKRKQLINKLSDIQAFHKECGKPTVAYGLAEFDPTKDFRVQDVFERADQAMRVNKNSLRGIHQKRDSESEEKLLKFSSDDNTRKFYELYIKMVSKMTDMSGNVKANIPDIEAILIEISIMHRLSKGVTRLYRNPEEEAKGGGETLCCFDTGIEGKEVLSVRTVTSVMSIATMTVYMAPDEPPLTEEEYWRVELVMRTTLSYVSRNRLKDIVYELAYFDDVGFLNHRSFFRHIQKIRNEIGGMIGVMYNLLHFTLVNQELGRKTGDLVMKNHYEGMRKLVGENGIVCRLGGDNFVALFSRERMGQVFGYLMDAPVVYDMEDERTVSISTTIGVYRIPPDAVIDNPGLVMECLVVAYSAAKSGGKDRIVFYDETLISARGSAMKVQTLFPEALKNEEFTVYYQPKVHTETGNIIGAEALCRWFHDGKMISPGEFIPVLEETDDICKLDFYMLDHVCRDIRRWLDQGRKAIRISVNLSRKHMMNRNLLDQLLKIIDRHNVPHSCIEIELTETTTDVAFADLKRIVTGLQSEGIFASVDDFGIGYSSLNLIRELPWNVLKVDRSLVPMDDDDTSVNSIMFRYVIAMVNELGIECIVEGVETAKQLALLQKNNCLYAQGFLFDRPLPVKEFEQRMLVGSYPLPEE